MGCFIAGLRDEIRLDVKVKQAKTLSDTIGVARLIEERNSLHKKHGGNSIFRALHTSPFQRNKPSTAVGLLGPPLTQSLALLFVAFPVKRQEITAKKGFASTVMRSLCHVTDASVCSSS